MKSKGLSLLRHRWTALYLSVWKHEWYYINKYFYTRHLHDKLSFQGVRVSLAGGIDLQSLLLKRLRKEKCKINGGLPTLVVC